MAVPFPVAVPVALEGTGGPKHMVIFNSSCLCPELGQLAMSGQFDLYFTSVKYETPLPQTTGPETMKFIRRREGPLVNTLQNFINTMWRWGYVVIICGAVDEDLYVAAATKSFFIAASWVNPEALVQRYGIPAPTPSKMIALLQIIANQTNWYYSCYFHSPVPTKVVSLCLANTYSRSVHVSPDEREMAEAFQAILKNEAGPNPVIKQALLCHLMAAIAHDTDFREVQDWAVAPSSSRLPNQIMEELKEHVRWMMNGRKPAPIFIRHTGTSKSRFDGPQRQMDMNYCQKHFRSIRVNEAYRGKLRGRVVCVFDDYLTHGNTFEALRNLLVACGVKKIIFVSIGKFMRSNENAYAQKLFSIDGDVHRVNYNATFNGVVHHFVSIDIAAKRSLGDLRLLASYLQ